MITLVVAVAAHGVIGRGAVLPWHLPDDLKRFKALTLGKPVVMGRRTFESIGKPLPGRRNIVITRAPERLIEGVELAHSFDDARRLGGDVPELCVIGGAEIFREALPHAGRIYLTRVHAEVAGDVHFPLQDFSQWRELERSEHPADARHFCAMTFLTLER